MSRRRGQVRATRSSQERNTVVWYCSGRDAHAETRVEQAAPGIVRCPLCGEEKPVGYKRRKQAREAGLAKVDISYLPF